MIDGRAKEHLRDALQWAREAVLGKLDGLGEYDVRRPLTPTGTNLLGLVKHLSLTEAWYLGEVFGRPFPDPWWKGPAAGDDEVAALFEHKLALADMWATEHESRGDVVDRYRRTWAHADATVDALELDAPGRVAWWPRPDVRLLNILVHVANETNRHAGHADILREQLDGTVGADVARTIDVDDTDWAAHRARIETAARAAAQLDS